MSQAACESIPAEVANILHFVLQANFRKVVQRVYFLELVVGTEEKLLV